MPPRSGWIGLVDAGLAEDIGPGDATSAALLPPEAPGHARIEARQSLVLSGLEVARATFERLGAELEPRAGDGDRLDDGDELARVRGPAQAILAGERTALNFLQRLCGIATRTREFCDAVRDAPAEIVDTRKTTPGWRSLEKYAVRCGGGGNHRLGLFDGILIKDNHLQAVGGVAPAVERVRAQGSRHLRVRVEVETLEQAREAIEAGADAILIDNQPPESTRAFVELAQGRVRTEASGGIRLENVAAVAATGVDEISVGALTHSAPAADIALEWLER
ncbi:MAG: carboxylating nicotinate-nucleotide diphosphorylase [Proteobacteria bacterium]|nr:carboxylating nicotinate-nucleotide diphosphorylase [Pseudomonadota bacterium]